MSTNTTFASRVRSHIAASKEPKQPMPVHTLCEDCRRIFNSPLYERYTGCAWSYQSPHDPRTQERSFGQIEYQAQYGGCYICYHLWRPVGKTMSRMASKMPLYKSRHMGEARVDFQVRSKPKEIVSSLGFELKWGALATESTGFLLVPVDTLSGACGRKRVMIVHTKHALDESLDANKVTKIGGALHMVSKLSASTRCEENWANIFDWLQLCNPEQHPRCYSNASAYKMPTRLIDVREDNNLRIVTIATVHPGEKHPYVALSHCWGKTNFLNLDSNTAEQLYTGFSETLLPRSFQDTVAVARRLGIFYLWIDSLCIMQDSEEDWLQESESMADVFSGAYCTIAATAAHDSSEGLFFERTPATTQPFRVTTTWKSNRPESFNLSNNYLIYPENYWQDMESLAPLLTRAWVVQERILSRRIIHFAKPQIFWECSHLMACEVFPAGVPSKPLYISFYKPDRGNEESTTSIETTDQPYLDPYSWKSIVQVYTSCKLTFGKDKLTALAGIAKAFGSADISRGRYLAGLWEKDFLRQLLWRIKGDQVAERPEKYRAPSWSWASLDTKFAGVAVFEHPKHIVPRVVRLIDVGTSLTSSGRQNEDAVTMTCRWYARVEGPLHKVILWRRETLLGIIHTDVLVPALHPPFNRFQGFLDDDSKYHDLPHGDVYLVPLLLADAEDGKAILRGLLIQKAEEPLENLIPRALFRRIGMALAASFQLTAADAAKLFRGAPRLPPDSYEGRREVVIEGQTHYSYRFTLI